MDATYTKTADGWALRVDGTDVPAPGRVLTVRKRDGSEQTQVAGPLIEKKAGTVIVAIGAKDERSKRCSCCLTVNATGNRVCAECGTVLNT